MLSFELLKDVQDYIIARYNPDNDFPIPSFLKSVGISEGTNPPDKAPSSKETNPPQPKAAGSNPFKKKKLQKEKPAFTFGNKTHQGPSILSGLTCEEDIDDIDFDEECHKPELSPLRKILANADAGFGQILLEYIDASGMTDAEVYRKAQISRSHFNKIKNDPNYHVQKETVMAFILALKLDFGAASELLGKAGYAFTNSSKSDLIIRYCIEHGIFDVIEVNQLLFSFDQKLLGAGIKE